jgi:hypothetical protein
VTLSPVENSGRSAYPLLRNGTRSSIERNYRIRAALARTSEPPRRECATPARPSNSSSGFQWHRLPACDSAFYTCDRALSSPSEPSPPVNRGRAEEWVHTRRTRRARDSKVTGGRRLDVIHRPETTVITSLSGCATLAGCGTTYLRMKNVSAPCDKTGFLPLVLSRLRGKLQRGKQAAKTFSAAC